MLGEIEEMRTRLALMLVDGGVKDTDLGIELCRNARLVVENAELRGELVRVASVAGEAIGTAPVFRNSACVDVLADAYAQARQQLAEARQEISDRKESEQTTLDDVVDLLTELEQTKLRIAELERG